MRGVKEGSERREGEERRREVKEGKKRSEGGK